MSQGYERNVLPIYFLEAKYEFLNTLRTPGFVLPSLAFPLMFYAFFGIAFGGGNGGQQAAYLAATYGVFGVIGPALFGFGVGIATERSQGWLMLKQASPMPGMAYFTAKLTMSLIFAQMILILLFSLAAFGGNVNFTPGQWATLYLTISLGNIPFCALGLLIGSWSPARASVAIVNLVYLPMSFLSGLWIPVNMLPKFMGDLAVLFPPYHLAQLALKVIDMDQGGQVWVHVVVLLVQTVLFLWLALIGFRRKVRD